MRSVDSLIESLALRSYLVDPAATDADLMELGKRQLASDLRQDHRAGRIAENHRLMTGVTVTLEKVYEPAPMMAGAVMSPAPGK